MILATAGHVDHGKSTLVRLLTGTDPDRWEEERRRGLTIDLGFARLVLDDGRELDVVDVPGHQRFVPNMLAGCGAVDLVLFVVSAREGWQAQTGEHLRILAAHGVGAGVVALTHADLVDEARLEEVAAQVAEHGAGTFLDGAEAVPTAAPDPSSVERLRAALARAAGDDAAAPPGPGDDEGPGVGADRVRLWVDRSFTLRGVGRVVTGTLTGGTLRLGQRLDLVADRAQPLAPAEVRVRGLHRFGQALDAVGPGHRVGVHLAGLDAEPARGDALVAADRWAVARSFQVALLPTAAVDRPGRRAGRPAGGTGPGGSGDDRPRPRGAYRAFVGTAHAVGQLRYPDLGVDLPGGAVLARLHLERPLGPVAPGDRVVLRDDGAGTTVAGGVLLACDDRPTRYPSDELARRAEALAADPDRPPGPTSAQTPQRSAALAAAVLGARGGAVGAAELRRLVGWVDGVPGVALVGPLAVAAEPLAARVAALEGALVAAGDGGVPEPADLLGRAAVDVLQAQGHVDRHGTQIVAADVDPRRQAIDRAAIAVRAALDAADPPLCTRDELRRATGVGGRDVADLVAQGSLVEIGPLVTTPDRAQAWADQVVAAVEATPEGATVSELRQVLGLTRKYAVPLLEWCDARRITARSGDRRRRHP